MKTKLHIPNPCNEKWNAMVPDKNGRFCNSCSKTVVDFTKMKDPEIQKYFTDNSVKERICGHFKLSQIKTEGSIKYAGLRNRISKIRLKPLKQLALFSLSILFTLTSCMGKAAVDGEPNVVDGSANEYEITTENKNTEQVNDSLKSDVIQLKKTNE